MLTKILQKFCSIFIFRIYFTPKLNFNEIGGGGTTDFFPVIGVIGYFFNNQTITEKTEKIGYYNRNHNRKNRKKWLL